MIPGDRVFRILCRRCRLTLPTPPMLVRPCTNCGAVDYVAIAVTYRGTLQAIGAWVDEDGARRYGTPATAPRFKMV